MGSFFSDVLSFEHEVAIYDTDPQRLRFTFNTQRMTTMEEIEAFKPELLINAATVKYTIPAFESVLPHIPESCIISDIASVKTGLPEFYKKAKRSFVSTPPDVRPHVCQPRQSIRRKCHHHHRVGPFGKSLFQRPIQSSAPQHLRIHIQATR